VVEREGAMVIHLDRLGHRLLRCGGVCDIEVAFERFPFFESYF